MVEIDAMWNTTRRLTGVNIGLKSFLTGALRNNILQQSLLRMVNQLGMVQSVYRAYELGR